MAQVAQSHDKLSSRPSRFGKAIAGIVVCGLVARAIYAYLIVRSNPAIGDGQEFETIANLIAGGHGYVRFGPNFFGPLLPTADKPPLFPYLEAGISALGGRTWAWHHLVGILSGGGTIAVVGLVGRRLAGPRAGLIAAGIAALYPLLIATDGSLRSESVYALMISLVLLAALRVRESATGQRLAALGALIGLAALTRSEALLLLVLLPFPLAGLRRGLVAVIACAVVLAPWFIRCWATFGQPVLISTNFGGLVAGANCDKTYHGELLGQWSFSCLVATGPSQSNEATNSNRLRDAGLRYARDHASRLPIVFAARLGRTFDLFRPLQNARLEAFTEGRNLTVERVGLVVYYLLAALAIRGAVILRRRRGPLGILLAPFVLVVFVSITAYGSTRLRVAAEPSLVLLAAIAIDERVRSTVSGSRIRLLAQSFQPRPHGPATIRRARHACCH